MRKATRSLGGFQQPRKSLKVMRILRFIKSHVEKSQSSGVVVGISGGIDSAVAATLSVEALGRDKVLGLLLFEDESKGSGDHVDAKRLISDLKINSVEVSITPIIESFKTSLAENTPSRLTLGNIKARIRMILLYAFANERNLLVVGTGDKSEERVGYFTKFGDGGVDIQPIAHLYKTEVRRLARTIGIPETIVSKPSSPNLWKGQKATDELPLEYSLLDAALNLLYDKKLDTRSVAKRLKIRLKTIREIERMRERNAHKLKPPPSLDV